MTKLCIYHGGNCADGFASAWVVNKVNNGVEFFAANYGDELPDCTGKDVLFVDFSAKQDVMRKIASVAKSVLVIDHHKTSQEDLKILAEEKLIDCVFDMDRSGCVLTWEYLCRPSEPVPLLLRHIQDRDLWRFELPNTKEVMAAVMSYPYDFNMFTGLVERMEDDPYDLIGEGRAILQAHEKNVETVIQSTLRIMKIGGHEVPVCNANSMFASDIGNKLCQGHGSLNPLFASTYFVNDKAQFCFSLRSIGDFDVSEIAKQYGGGGHKNAAGFTVDFLSDL